MAEFMGWVEGRVEGLSESQELALAALRAGATFGKAAEAAGVNRTTVYRWVHGDPHFRAAYNAWQQAAAESARARLTQLADLAVDDASSDATPEGMLHESVA
jgi:transposase-like protein